MKFLLCSLTLFTLCGKLVAQTDWEWQNPLPQGNYLWSVTMIDTDNIVTVGGAGLVMKTTDDGETWYKQFYVGNNMFWFTDASFPNANIGYIVGKASVESDSGIIMRSNDGGLNWFQQQVIGLSLHSLYGVCFINSDTGWVVGTAGAILRTTNGGQFWEDQSSPSFGLDLQRVYFTDARNGWAVGRWGSIIRTTNGGENWNLVYYNDSYDFYSICFIDSLIGYVGGVPGSLRRTTNGGTTWSVVNIPIGGYIGGIHFFSRDSGIVAGVNGMIFRTTNGGITWTQVNQMGGDDQILGLSFCDQNNGIAVGLRGALLRTYNGGITWTKLSSEITDITAFWGVCFATPNIGIVVGDEGVIFRTSNAGATWTLVSFGQSPVFREAAFADSLVGVTVGRYGVILRTTDAGISWSPPQINQANQQLFDVKFVTKEVGFAVGENNIVKTTDAGNTWFAQPYSGAGWVMGVYFFDTVNGFTVDLGGMIKHTTDGGNTWSIVTTLPSPTPLRRIDFSDSLTGVICGGLGTITRTTDGGATWNIVRQTPTPISEELFDVQFIDESTAYAVGPYGVIKSSDKGLNWVYEKSSALNLNGIHFFNSENGVVVGYASAILRAKSSVSPQFLVENRQILFPQTPIGTTAYDTITIKNIGNIPLIISNVSSSNTIFAINPSSATIEPSGNKLFIVSFSPDSLNEYSGNLIFVHNGDPSTDTIFVSGQGVTTVELSEPGIPQNFYLYQNYPNPFNPVTSIRFDLPKESHVEIKVFNIIGQKVATLVNTELKAGYHKIEWDASKLPSGIYFYQFLSENIKLIKKGVLAK